MIRAFEHGLATTDSTGKSAIDAYFESKKLRAPFAVSCSATGTLPYPTDLVWQIILETQHLGTWLDDRERGDRPLPARFGPGYCINASHGPTCIITSESSYNSNTLTFQRRFYVDQEPFYYTVSVKPFERFSSTVTVVAEGPQGSNRAAGLLGKIFGGIAADKQYVSTATTELSNRISGAIKRLAHLCWDRTRCGPSHPDYQHAGRWLLWHYGGDTIKYYENRTGHIGPEVGELIERGERIGFVHGSDNTRDISYWKENNYLEPGNGFVAEISKQHGDRIEKGDRVLLITEQKGADLSLGDIRIDYLDLHARQSAILETYRVTTGQPVQAGDVIAILKDRYGDQRFTVVSKYEGTILELLKSPGEPMHERFPWESVARIKVAVFPSNR